MTHNFNIWEGKYKNFKEVKKKFPIKNFELNTYKKKLTNNFDLSEKNLKNNKIIDKDLTSRSIYLPLLVALLSKKKKIEILDFGGGLGISYLYLLQCLPHLKKKISYTIVELNEICEIGKKKKIDINFVSKIPSKKYDIIFSSSAIQYIENWKDVLNNLIKLNCSYILLSDVFLTKNSSFVTLQNYYLNKIPQWFFNEKNFLYYFYNGKYKLIFKDTVMAKRLNYQSILPMKNFKKSDRVNNTFHLLFHNGKK